MRCLIVDDESLAREGIVRHLRAHRHVEVTGEAASVSEALELVENCHPDLIFLDVQLRGETGFDLLARLEPPGPQVIFVTAHSNYALHAFRADAVDYLLKPIRPEHLAEALVRAAARRQVLELSPEAATNALRGLGLTHREAEVSYWISQSKTNQEIASILEISAETVKKQVQKVLANLGVDSRLAVALRASEFLARK